MDRRPAPAAPATAVCAGGGRTTRATAPGGRRAFAACAYDWRRMKSLRESHTNLFTSCPGLSYCIHTVRASLPGLTRQSIILRKTLVKIDGYAGQARV